MNRALMLRQYLKSEVSYREDAVLSEDIYSHHDSQWRPMPSTLG
ncbi:hypothetical protein [Photobacterium sp. OFAV2-7]|nr:hypothetical protein [Photobacterium sp. OFAV2-7]